MIVPNSIRASLFAAVLLTLQVNPLSALSCEPHPALTMYRLLAPEAGQGAVRRAATEAVRLWLAPHEIAIEARLVAIECDDQSAKARLEDIVWLRGRTAHAGPVAEALLPHLPHLGCQGISPVQSVTRLYFASRAGAGEVHGAQMVISFCSAFDASLPEHIDSEIAAVERHAERRKQPARVAHLQILKDEIAKQLAELRSQAATYSSYPPQDQAIPRGGILERLLRPQR